MKKIFIFVVLLLFANISYAQQVTVTGIGDDKDKAVKDALRTAVEQVIGVYINSNTVVSKSQVELDKIYAASEGYINDFRVLRTAYKGDKCHVQVRVDVDTEPNSKLLSDLQLTYLLDNPSIMVKVSGSRYAGICEAAIVGKLRDMGLDVVAAKSAPQIQVIAEPDTISAQGNTSADNVDANDNSQEENGNDSDADSGSDVSGNDNDFKEEDIEMEKYSENDQQSENGNDENNDNKDNDEENNNKEQNQNNLNDEILPVNTIPVSEQGKTPTLSDWGTDELDADLSSYTVRCILSEGSMNVTLPNFDVAGKRTKVGNNATGLFKGIINANVDVVKNDTKSVIQQFYLTDTKIYSSADIAKQMAVEGVSSQIANKVAEIFSHHAALVKSNK